MQLGRRAAYVVGLRARCIVGRKPRASVLTLKSGPQVYAVRLRWLLLQNESGEGGRESPNSPDRELHTQHSAPETRSEREHA